MMASSRIMVLLVVLICSSTGSAYGQDFLVGTVLAVDTEQLELMLMVQNGSEGSAADKGKSILIRIATENNLPSLNRRTVLPGCVETGEMIRVWGQKLDQAEAVFLATDIRGCRGGGCSDATGVRSRLLKKRMGFRGGRLGFEFSGQHEHGAEDRGRGNGGHGGGGNGGGGGGR